MDSKPINNMGNHTALLGICGEETTETEETKLRKHFVLASLMLSLLTLTALMPVVKAVTYYWDGIRFVAGDGWKPRFVEKVYPSG